MPLPVAVGWTVYAKEDKGWELKNETATFGIKSSRVDS